MTSNPIAAETSTGWNFDNSYARLPDYFFHSCNPVAVRAPRLAVLNETLAHTLGLSFRQYSPDDIAAILSGNRLPPGAQPLAQAYDGHQFGNFTMLGDGRAILLGEHVTPRGARVDIQLKGSGQTPFSRRGDGRAALGPMLREYIISEAMAALGVPTTRSLAVVHTGEPVLRETPLAGAILTRVAASHLRVGTFEYVAMREDVGGLKILADYAIARHYPECAKAEQPYIAFLDAVMERQAALIAAWLHVGFIHGVMNTDNMAISGETIDYGPCAFMDAYDPATVFSAIDHHGRYAYANQPTIAQWNLARFAETLLPLLDASMPRAVELAEGRIELFSTQFQAHWLAGMRRKLGLVAQEPEDIALVATLLQWMQRHRADYTTSFRMLSSPNLCDAIDVQDAEFKGWHTRWQARLGQESASAASPYDLMRASNPAIIPRNHQVEAALAAAIEQGDMTVMHRLLAALSTPYEDGPAQANYRHPPAPTQRIYQTFCGT